MLYRNDNRKSRFPHSLTVFAFALLILAPAKAQATSLNALLRMPAFVNLVVAIARVNQSMRSAAENPMDEFRRKNVRVAINAMPGAIVGLANEFQAGRLHNGDLKFVQSLLGGFVDVNAADNYKKFLHAPSAALIPQVGAGLPSHLMHAPAESTGNGSGQRIEYDDSVAKGRSVASAPVVEDTAGLESVGVVRDNSQVSQSALADATRDLASIEASQYRIQTQPKYWQFGRLIHHAEALLIQSAQAEEGEDCQDCKKGRGGGGGGGGGGEGGKDAAMTLFGVAAIMASVAPVVAASIQANADQKIAEQQSTAQMYITDRTVQNSQALAQVQQQTALQTAQMQAQVAAQNNQGVTERLSMQLASLDKARQDAALMEQQRMAMEQQYNDRRIALAEAQAQQNLLLAQQTIGAQVTQAGSAYGATGGLTGTPAAAQSFGSSLASAGGDPSTMASALSSAPTGLGFRSDESVVSALSQNTAAAPSSGDQRLIASLGTNVVGRGLASIPSTSDSEQSETDLKTTPAARGLKSATESRLLSALRVRPSAALVAGSSKRAMVSTAASKSDISSFIGQPAQTTQSSFAQYQQTLVPHAASSAGTARGLVGTGHAGAYNAP